MSFLRLLEGLRTPILDGFFSFITNFGDEIGFLVLALTVYWCVNKRYGYYIFMVGLSGTVLNQFLKLWFRIPRPWVLDTDFTIVESARAGASGYSFPSGHTQNILCTAGGLSVCTRKKWVRGLCWMLAALVAFSRMYLGVHTPLDVGVSLGLAGLLLAAFYPVTRSEERLRRWMPWMLGGFLLLSCAYLLFVRGYAFPADVDAGNLASGTKNAYMLTGCAVGFIGIYLLDQHWLRFQTKAPLTGQILKVALGLGLMMLVRGGLKAPLNALFQNSGWATLVRYFLTVMIVGGLWPLSFPLFARMGKQKK